MIDWITPAISLIKSVHPGYETEYVPGDGRTPNEAAEQQPGEGWKVGGFWDDDSEFGKRGCIVLQRKKPSA